MVEKITLDKWKSLGFRIEEINLWISFLLLQR
jgi:hypothetical protein